ncbi:class I SAM-dependent methyltransferase [bacterium]|nr:class I SAM-dependent methyltransferase [bacterium]
MIERVSERESVRTIGMCAVCGTDEDASIVMDFGDYAVSRCSACGLVYLSGERDGDPDRTRCFTDHFDSGYMRSFNPNVIASEQVSSVFKALSLVGTSLDRLSVEAPVLEIGCARGHFLHRLQAHIPERSLVGVDVSRRMTERGRQEFGLDLRGCSFEEAELPADSFGLVVAFDVLEHVARPQLVVGKILRLLHPEGWAVVEVPSERTAFRWLARAAYTTSRQRLAAPLRALYHTAHLTYFTPKSLRLLLQCFGAADVIIATKEAHITRFGAGRYGPLASSGIRAVACLDRVLGTQAKLLCAFHRCV